MNFAFDLPLPVPPLFRFSLFIIGADAKQEFASG